MSLQLIAVGKRHCRVLRDAIAINYFEVGKQHCCVLHEGAIDYFEVGKRHCRVLFRNRDRKR